MAAGLRDAVEGGASIMAGGNSLADHLTADERSRLMAKVRGKNTKPELKVRSALHGMGFRFRLHRKDLLGCPDIVLPRLRTVIFVHGCFWHGHEGCKRSSLPNTRRDFWTTKIGRNMERDAAAADGLEMAGYKVLTFWECQLKTDDQVKALIRAQLGGCHAKEIETE